MQQRRSTLAEVHGIAVVLSAKILGHVGDISRFPNVDHFASYTGTSPLDASSGNHDRHRLNTGGNRQLNTALHTIAVCQARDAGPGRTYSFARSGKVRRQQRLAGPSNDASRTSSTATSSKINKNGIPSALDTQRRYQVAPVGPDHR
jgi:transposase